MESLLNGWVPPAPAPAEGAVEAYSHFQKAWWLDAVAPDRWSEVQVFESGKLKARWPFVHKSSMGLKGLTMPPLTAHLGPWFAVKGGRETTQQGEYKRLLHLLVEKLPKADLMTASFHPSLSGLPSLDWMGYEVNTAFSHGFDDCSNPDAILKAMEGTVRSRIRKAANTVRINTEVRLERMFDIQKQTFGRQGMDVPFEFELLERVDAACRSHQASVRLSAEDASGNIHAVSYLMVDHGTLRGVFRGTDQAHRTSGANTLLIWETILLAHRMGLSYDFGGSMMPTIAKFNESFGTLPRPYLVARRVSSRFRKLQALRTLATLGSR